MGKPVLFTVSGNRENQDRVVFIEHDSRMVLCVADGAEGLSGGLEAADMGIGLVRKNVAVAATSELCSELLRQIDSAIHKDPI